MNEIFEVAIEADFFFDEEEGKKVAYAPEERHWVDSYWTDEATALEVAEKLWKYDSDEYYVRITVLGHKLNVCGDGTNTFDRKRDRVIKSWH